MNTSELLYAHASKDIGLRETPGARSTPRIAFAIRLAADWLDKDDSKTAWCGCIRGLWGIETGTGIPSAHYRAVNWSTWGQGVHSLSSAIRGDTVILKRPGGYHVALLDRYTASKEFVYLLGGNQSDTVCVSRYSANSIHAIRR